MIWRPIPSWPGYEVSEVGDVRSVDRKHETSNRWGPMVRLVRGRKLAQWEDKDGYLRVTLCQDGDQMSFNIARLVLFAFVGMPPLGQPEACHANHIRHDNALSNLSWGSRQENEDQKTAAGRRPRKEAA